MWATKFKSHSEEIRHGPTSLMWDASFPGAAAVYGIPEHATSMALRPTMVRVRPRLLRSSSNMDRVCTREKRADVGNSSGAGSRALLGCMFDEDRTIQGEGINSEPYRLFNLDVFEYLHESPFGLYGSIPFLMAHGPRGATGLFWLNAAEMYVDVSVAATTAHPQTSWIAETGMLDVFIMTGVCAATAFSKSGPFSP